MAGVASLISIPLILDGGKIAFSIVNENRDKCLIISLIQTSRFDELICVLIFTSKTLFLVLFYM